MINKNLPDTKYLILELENSWLTIWFNRPEKKNALSDDLINEVKLTLLSIEQDFTIRGIIFRGKGGIFCAGADLKKIKEITASENDSHYLALKMSKQIGSLFEQISKAPQIIVSVVEGAAMAGAFGIACTSDFIISMSNSKYALTETQLGLTPAQIAPYVLKRLGFSQGKKLLLLGTMFNGKEGFEMGMVDYLAHNDKDIDQHIINIKNNVNKCAPLAISLTKRVIADGEDIDLDKAAELFSRSINSNEGRDGLASFFEKRKPFWDNN
jgi:isohexenylglutaconyl-CoA hydratase